MTSQPGFQTIAIHRLPNMSQGKGNQTMKFGHLTEYNKKKKFFQKLCINWGEETSYKSHFIFFYKSLKWDESKWSVV